MSNSKSAVRASQPEIESVRSSAFFKVYSNSVQIETGPWDFRLIFGEVTKSGENKITIEQSVGVVMSPQHAKALLGVLAHNIRAYEDRVGEIKLPAEDPEDRAQSTDSKGRAIIHQRQQRSP